MPAGLRLVWKRFSEYSHPIFSTPIVWRPNTMMIAPAILPRSESFAMRN